MSLFLGLLLCGQCDRALESSQALALAGLPKSRNCASGFVFDLFFNSLKINSYFCLLEAGCRRVVRDVE
ncbi:MAG TPA: hypothetical protein PK873_16675 [Pseudomonas sp.]|uniref:hypothetical protein n=1 Tax=Pseudomonas sp. TaxID=306 RepID=UPI002C5A1BF5|nr:hypothetical protein [Pseudomonas sp.]HRL95178.1 hypothetical protein [Pseudomonas sp.]